MIFDHGGLALNLFELKAVKKQITDRGGFLIFEFHNIIRNTEVRYNSNIWEDRSFENADITQYFEDRIDLELHYQEWVGIWQQWTDYVKNMEMDIDFNPLRR